MTRPRQDLRPHEVALIIVALAVLLWIGWRALTLEELHRSESMAVELPESSDDPEALRSEWRRWRP